MTGEPEGPDEPFLRWAANALGDQRTPEARGLRDGGQPWLLSFRGGGADDLSAVLRTAPIPPSTPGVEVIDDRSTLTGQAREIAGMTDALAAGVPVPIVLAHTRSAGEAVHAGRDALLIEYIDGTSSQPLLPDVRRLEAIGAVAARIARVPADPRLPFVSHPIPDVDFAALRAEGLAQPLMAEAERLVDEIAPDDPIGFVHGDLWSGNTLWRDDLLVAVLDWDCAGRGTAGIDLGSLRCDAALCFGAGAADHVLRGWEGEAGHPAASVSYWDVVAALSTPPDISWFAPAISGMTNRPDLTADILRARRDRFLGGAVSRLTSERG